MALDQTVKDTILSRIVAGELVPVVFNDLDVSMEDRKAFREEYHTQVSDAIKASAKEALRSSLPVDKLDERIAKLNTRITELTAELSELQAEKDSRPV